MFTGLIEAIGKIQEKMPNALTVSRPESFDDLHLGSSVAVSGVCLSVTALTAHSMSFDVVEETLKRTTLGQFKVGSKVNLERSLATQGRFEGHIVQGHVEGVAKVLSMTSKGSSHSNTNSVLILSLPKGLSAFCIEKGSIAIDGVSLTIASLKDTTCSVALIPHTLSHTTLADAQKDDLLNIETDPLIRAVLTKKLS